MAAKKAKVETTTIDFSNSIEKIKESAKTVNTEVVDTTVEVLEDLKTNGEKIREVATTKVKEAIENVTVGNGVKFVKNTAKGIHQYNIETAEEIIEATVDGTKALQNFIAKSLKNGVDFWGQQQNITLTALEELKKQYGTPEFKFNLKDLFNFDFGFSGGAAVSKEVAKKTATITKTAKTAAKKTAKTVKAKKATVKTTAKKVVAKVAKPTVKKVTAKVTKPATKKVATKATAKTVAKKVTAKVTKPATKKVATKATAKTVAKKVTAKVTKPAAKKATTARKNSLRTIEGIGPKIEGLLNAGGIFTFQQLADAPQATLKAILTAAGSRYQMHNPATWNQQAALAAAGKTAELAKLQDELKGGKVAK